MNNRYTFIMTLYQSYTVIIATNDYAILKMLKIIHIKTKSKTNFVYINLKINVIYLFKVGVTIYYWSPYIQLFSMLLILC